MHKNFLSLAAAAVLLAACASSPMSSQAGTPPLAMKGGMLVDAKGMTVYTFDRDVAGSGKSACNGPCAAKWPPVLANGNDKASGDYTVVARDDGQHQWAYKGKPLYTWVSDKQPGETSGDNVGKVWHIVR